MKGRAQKKNKKKKQKRANVRNENNNDKPVNGGVREKTRARMK